MSPWTDPDPQGRRLHGPTIWRVLIVAALLLGAVNIALSAHLFAVSNEATQSTRAFAQDSRELNCRIGAFLVGAPIEQLPGESDQAFTHAVRKAEGFLRALKAVDCDQVKGASVSAQQIDRQLHHLRHVVPRGGDESGNPGGGGGLPGPPPGGPPPNPQPQPEHCTVEVNPATGEKVCVDLTVPDLP